MSLRIGDNFSYLGKKFLDERESFDTLAKMQNCNDVPDGFITYCKEDGKRYEFKNNQWVEFSVNVDLEDYATKDFVKDSIADVDVTEQLEDYVTKDELEDKGYLTEHQSLSDYAKKTELPTKTSQLTNDSGYITSIPGEYVTESELSAKGYLTEHQSLEGYATEDYVGEKVADMVDSAPETLDTLNELAQALGEDPNFATTVATKIGKKADKTELEELATTVSETYTTKDEFNNLSIGGRNLIKNSAFLDGTAYWTCANNPNTTTTVDNNMVFNGHPSLKMVSSGWTTGKWYGARNWEIPRGDASIKAEETVTISCWYYVVDKSKFDNGMGFEIKGIKDDGTDSTAIYILVQPNDIVENKWTRVSKTTKVPYNFNNIYAFLYVTQNGEVWFADVKFEKGNKATAWTPAPEDYSTTTQMNSAIQTSADTITQTVSETYTTKDEFNNLSIGGRNYVLNGNFQGCIKNTTTIPKWNYWGGVRVFIHQGDVAYSTPGTLYLMSDVETGGGIYQEISKDKIPKNTEFTLSFNSEIESNVKFANFGVDYRDSSNVVLSEKYYRIDTLKDRKTFTFTTPNVDFAKMRIIFYHGGSTSTSGSFLWTIQNVKLEKGNKTTDFTPAPEDYSTTTEMNSAIQQKIDNLIIGGRNLITNSSPSSVWNISNATNWSRTLVDCLSSPSGKAMRVTSNTTNDNTTGGVFTSVNADLLDDGEEYTMSLYIRANKNMGIYFKNELTVATYKHTVSTEWKLYTFTGIVDKTRPLHSCVVYFNGSVETGDWYEFHSVKFEKGNKPTAWTPAPEDYSTTSQMNSTIEQKLDSSLGELEKIETSATEPTDSSVNIWINTSEDTPTNALARINDSTMASNTTWSSEKIYKEMVDIQTGGEIDLSGYALKSELPTKTSQLENDSDFLTSIPSEYVTETELNNKGYITSIPSEYVTETELNDKGYLTQHQDLSAYAKKIELPTKTSQLTNDSNFLTNIPSEYVTDSELNAKGYLTEHQSLSDYAKKTDIPSVPTKVSQLTNDSGYITSVPPEYITDSELNAKGYLTQHQDLSAYAKKSELPTKVSQLTNDSKYLTSVPSEYITEMELDAKGYLTNNSLNYVTPQMFGAKANGIDDDTKAINDAIESANNGGVVYFPEGTYKVSSSSSSSLDESRRYFAIRIYQKENLKLVLSPKAHIKHRLQTQQEITDGNQARYYVIGIMKSENIQVIGGKIEGEADEHIITYKDNSSLFWWQTDGTYSRCQGHGISVRSSEDVLIQDCEIFNCFGDSVIVGTNSANEKSKNVTIERCDLHNSIRQGISITGADNTIIRDCEIYNISGCSPQSGIDFEPNTVGEMNIGSLVDNCYIHDCQGSALIHSKANNGAKVKDCRLHGRVTTFDDDVYPVEYINCDMLIYHSSSAYRNSLYNCRIASCMMYEMGDDFYDCIFNPHLFNHVIANYGASVSNLIESGDSLLQNSQARFYRCQFITENNNTYSSVFRLWKNGGVIGSALFDNCTFLLGKHSYQALEIKVSKKLEMTRCLFVTSATSYSTQFIELTAPNSLILKDNVFDVKTLTSYSGYNSLLRLYTKDVIVEGCGFLATSQICTYPIAQTFISDVGEIYILRNCMPMWDSIGLLASSTAYKFVTSNNVTSIIENTEVQEQLEQLEVELKAYTDVRVNDLTAQGMQQTPLFASRIEDCTDASKVYVLPDGNIYGCVTTWDEGGKPLFKDWLPLSIKADGSLYNEGVGYTANTKLASDGTQAEVSGCFSTGFIPVKPNDVVRFANITKGTSNGLFQYNSSFTKVGSTYYWDNLTDEGNGVYSRVIQNLNTIAYIRLCTGISSETRVSINEPITYTEPSSVTEWKDTGHAFVVNLNGEGFATKTYINNQLSNYAKTTDLHSHSNKSVIDGISSTNISNWGSAYTHSTSAHAPSNAQKNSDITKGEIENKLTGNITTHTHSQYLTSHQDLSAYAKKTDVPTKVSQLTNDKNYLTSVPSEYVTDSELNAKGYLTQHQDLSAYAKTSQIPTKVSQLTNDSKFLTSIPSEYVTESELTAKDYATKEIGVYYIQGGGSSGVWTGTHPDITKYYSGLTINYKVSVAGKSSGTTLNINGLGAIPVVRSVTTGINYPVNSIVNLVYTVDGSTAYWKSPDYDGENKTNSNNLTGTKLFLVGAKVQASTGATTNSNASCYIGTDNCLYSGGNKVAVQSDIPTVEEIAQQVIDMLGDGNEVAY